MNRNALPASLKARVLETAKATSSPIRQSVAFETSLLLLTGGAAMLNVFLAAGGANLGPRSPALVITTMLGRGTLALGATWASLGRGGSMLGRSLSWLVGTAVATPLAIAGWMVLAARNWVMVAGSAWHCVPTAFLVGLVALVVFALVHRQSDLAHPLATGAALGAAAGAWADVAMVLHCPDHDLVHRLLCHVGPTAILVAVGIALGALVIRPSSASDRSESDRSVAHRFDNGGLR